MIVAALQVATTKLSKRSPRLGIIAGLILEYGLRITEILKIRWIDLKSNDKVLIRGIKRSRNRIIDVSDYKEYFDNCKEKGIDPFSDLDYFYVYREFKKAGFQVVLQDKGKNLITHAGRHLLIKILRKDGIQDEDIANLTGHKNVKSTQHYGKW